MKQCVCHNSAGHDSFSCGCPCHEAEKQSIVTFDFKLYQQVKIIELGLLGTVRQLNVSYTGVSYQVRYFWNYKIEEVWFHAHELKAV